MILLSFYLFSLDNFFNSFTLTIVFFRNIPILGTLKINCQKVEAPVFSKMEVMKEDRGYFKLQGSNYLFRSDLQILTKEKF